MNLAQKYLEFSLEEYFLTLYKGIKNEENDFLVEYENFLKEINQLNEEEINEVLLKKITKIIKNFMFRA